MDEFKSWHFVFAEKEKLFQVGVKSAIPVTYDPVIGVIEILDKLDGCREWVVRKPQHEDSWVEEINAQFGVPPVSDYLSGNFFKLI